jgi:hypothetical protein
MRTDGRDHVRFGAHSGLGVAMALFPQSFDSVAKLFLRQPTQIFKAVHATI